MATGLLVTSGLNDPEVTSPFMASKILCSDIDPINASDYSRSYLHYKLAVGQSTKQAENSATNAVIAHNKRDCKLVMRTLEPSPMAIALHG